MEEACNVGHNTEFVWLGGIAQILHFEELLDIFERGTEAGVKKRHLLGYPDARQRSGMQVPYSHGDLPKPVV